MKQRGRKSSNSLSTVVSLPGVVPGQRPEPPAELTPEQAATWRAITGRMPSDWFQPESWPLLAQLCRHVSISRLVGSALAEIDPKAIADDKGFRRFTRLRGMHEKEGAAISSLMRTMRITHRSQYNQTVAHVAATKIPAGPRPWETS
jgi:hypothetical protein